MFSNGRTVNGSKVSHTHNVDFHHLIPSQLTTRSHEILQIQHVFRFLSCENAPAIHLSGSLQVNELNINFLKLLQFYIIIPFLTFKKCNIQTIQNSFLCVLLIVLCLSVGEKMRDCKLLGLNLETLCST